MRSYGMLVGKVDKEKYSNKDDVAYGFPGEASCRVLCQGAVKRWPQARNSWHLPLSSHWLLGNPWRKEWRPKNISSRRKIAEAGGRLIHAKDIQHHIVCIHKRGEAAREEGNGTELPE